MALRSDRLTEFAGELDELAKIQGAINQLEGQFYATQFYADVEGHPEDRNVKLALEELAFFSAELTVLGVYPASPFREHIREPAPASGRS